MLKAWDELRKVDVSSYCKERKTKDERGREVLIPYLPWGKCIDLLHANGAQHVAFTPVMENGSYLLCSREVETVPKSERDRPRKTGCYFVRVAVEIDDLKFTYDYPLMNGANVVYDDTLNQRAINTAHNRAFVKGVAIRTGLGWELWSREEDVDEPVEDLSSHKLSCIQKRIEERLTALLQSGMSVDDIAKAIGWKKATVDGVMTTYFRGIAALEEALKKL